MTDIRVAWDPAELVGDWVLTGSVLDTSKELVTALAVSIFTDGLAFADDIIPDGTNDRRGVWCDLDAAEIHDATPSGSRLWLLSREKHTERTRARAEQYVVECLAWLRTKGVATDYTVTAYWFGTGRLGIEIEVIRRGRENIAVRFEPLWREIEGGA